MRRLIPAHAGKTAAISSLRQNSGAHPRSRGENCPRAGRCLSHRGSSPLTRGKLPASWSMLVPPWLIPAHAGKTYYERKTGEPIRAHPRSRGENSAVSAVFASVRGSSPLTREKRALTTSRLQGFRLIPAHAGKTMYVSIHSRSVAAHPRSRGENPRAVMTSAARSMAHPRSRGENGGLTLSGHSDWGSSPLTRGKLGVVGGDHSGLRLIPAHAGKTRARRVPSSASRAHPRSRGENSALTRSTRLTSGSSPLTRGKHTDERGRAEPRGLIPAHAGKTK